MGRKFSDNMFVQFWVIEKCCHLVKSYGLEVEFCALCKYEIRNFVAVFVREYSKKIFERPKKLVWTGHMNEGF